MTTSRLATGPPRLVPPERLPARRLPRRSSSRPTDPADYPHADAVEQNVLVYGARLRDHVAAADGRREVQAELARALIDGPGIVVFAGAFPDPSVRRPGHRGVRRD